MHRVDRLTEQTRTHLGRTMLTYLLEHAQAHPERTSIYLSGDERSAAFLTSHTLLIGGEPDEQALRTLTDDVLSGSSGARLEALIVAEPTPSVAEFYRGRFPRVYSNFRMLHKLVSTGSSGDLAPVVPITRELLYGGTENASMIINEVIDTGTYADMDDFLQNGMGFAYVKDDRICGFITSEFPSDQSIAVGIMVEEAYQKQGIATAMTHAFIRKARTRAHSVYWDSWRGNEPSWRTAQKCGFEREGEYPVLFIPLNIENNIE